MTQTKVLVVDDDTSTIDLLSGRLSSSQLDAQFVADQKEALLFLNRWQPDVVMLNGRMAKRDDFALAQLFKEKQQDQKPVIVISSSPADGSPMGFRLRFNIQHFIQKPFDPETLADTLLGFAGAEPHAKPSGGGIDLQFDPARTQRNVLDIDDEYVNSYDRTALEQLSQDIKDTVGVFSTSTPVDIGPGTTTRKLRVKEYWYVVRNGENFTIQGINSVHVPTGEKNDLTKKDLLSKYNPEIEYLYTKLLPALRNLERSIARGDHHRRRMEHFSAEMEYNEALRLDAENVRATFGLGLTYLELQDSKKADTVFKSLIHLDAAFREEHKHLFNEFGIQLRKNKMFTHAVQYYDRARELSKEDEHIFFNLARAWYEKGDWSNCLRNLIICLTMNKRLEEAHRFCRHILTLSLDNDLCKELHKAPLQTPSGRYSPMLEELRKSSGMPDADWEALQNEVNAEKEKQQQAADLKKAAEEAAVPATISLKDTAETKKKSTGKVNGDPSGKYVMPF